MHQLEYFFLDSLRMGVLVLDRDSRLRFCNRWFRKHSASVSDDALGTPLHEVFPEIADTRLSIAIDQAIRFHLSSILTPGLNKPSFPLYAKPGDAHEQRHMQQLIHVIALKNPDFPCLLQIEDVTATVKRERRLKVQSTQLLDVTYQDALTGIGNRRRFDHALDEIHRKSKQARNSMALLMIDVDYFKPYNDRYGHPKGDECLRQVAQTLQQGLRQDSGDVLCRYGGEEFSIILRNTDEATACLVAERLRMRVEGAKLMHETSPRSPYVTVSIGIAVSHPDAERSASALVTGADMALYRAKEAGRNCSMCYDMDTMQSSPCA